MFSFAIVKKRTPAELADVLVDPGNRYGRTTGSYLDDFVALKKAIWLCDLCYPKFNARAYGYVHKMMGIYKLPHVQGCCDGCRDFSIRMRMLVHSSLKLE